MTEQGGGFGKGVVREIGTRIKGALAKVTHRRHSTSPEVNAAEAREVARMVFMRPPSDFTGWSTLGEIGVDDADSTLRPDWEGTDDVLGRPGVIAEHHEPT